LSDIVSVANILTL